jgi:hypothetical protein
MGTGILAKKQYLFGENPLDVCLKLQIGNPEEGMDQEKG